MRPLHWIALGLAAALISAVAGTIWLESRLNEATVCNTMPLRGLAQANRVLINSNSIAGDEEDRESYADAAEISALVSIIGAHNQYWHLNAFGAPVGDVSFEFFEDDRFVNSVELGENFLVMQGCGFFFAHEISPSVEADLRLWISVHLPDESLRIE